MNAKIGFLITVIATIMVAVFGIELGISESIDNGHPEYLAGALIVLAMLAIADILLYRSLHSINSDL